MPVIHQFDDVKWALLCKEFLLKEASSHCSSTKVSTVQVCKSLNVDVRQKATVPNWADDCQDTCKLTLWNISMWNIWTWRALVALATSWYSRKIRTASACAMRSILQVSASWRSWLHYYGPHHRACLTAPWSHTLDSSHRHILQNPPNP